MLKDVTGSNAGEARTVQDSGRAVLRAAMLDYGLGLRLVPRISCPRYSW